MITIVVGLYVNFSSLSTHAAETMQEQLRATAVLDRIARDLSGASLLTKPEADDDPFSHPWYFASTSQNAFGGADALKFISRSQRPKVSNYHVSDLAQIAYFTSIEEDGTTTLYRWSVPSLGSSYDPSFPVEDDPGSYVLAEGLASVLFRFRDELGEWKDEWDSTQLVQSGLLPTAVEIRVRPAPRDPEASDFTEEELPEFVRTVVLRQRPIDLAAMVEERLQAEAAALAEAAAGQNADDETLVDEDGNPIEGGAQGEMTVAECVVANRGQCNSTFGTDQCEVWTNVTLPLSAFGISLPFCQ